jgi:hypothetical protein
MGAFMALPVAAWITSFVKHCGSSYPLVYRSAYDDPDPSSEPTAPATGAP